MLGVLPTSLDVNGKEYEIRTDYRDVLRVMEAMDDPELTDADKSYIMLCVMFKDMTQIPTEDYEEALYKISEFINCEARHDGKQSHKTMDWSQDSPLIFSAINRVAGKEVRSMEYLHWWTFMGYFMEIGECTFATVQSIRSKKAKGKKLEKWEKDFWASNKAICELKPKLSDEERKKRDRMNKLLGG